MIGDVILFWFSRYRQVGCSQASMASIYFTQPMADMFYSALASSRYDASFVNSLAFRSLFTLLFPQRSCYWYGLLLWALSV